MKKSSSSSFRIAALFVALAMVLQFVAVIFLTPAGLSKVYPFAVDVAAENVVPDYSFDEYYDLKGEFEGSDLFFIGADTTVAESYTVILDLMRFLCRNFGVKTLALNVGRSTVKHINDCIATKDAAELQEQITSLRSAGIFPEEFISFVRSLVALDHTLPSGSGITVVSVYSESAARATVDRVHSEIISRWGNASEAIMESLSISEIDDFFDHFFAHPDDYRKFLGDEEFEFFVQINAHRLAGDYREWRIASQIEEYVSSPILVAVEREVVGADSPLRSYAERMGKTASYVSASYVSCRGLSKGEEVEISDFSLPFAPDRGIFFVSAESISRFTRWSDFVCDPSGTGAASAPFSVTPDYFVIVGSKTVKYGDSTR